MALYPLASFKQIIIALLFRILMLISGCAYFAADRAFYLRRDYGSSDEGCFLYHSAMSIMTFLHPPPRKRSWVEIDMGPISKLRVTDVQKLVHVYLTQF